MKHLHGFVLIVAFALVGAVSDEGNCEANDKDCAATDATSLLQARAQEASIAPQDYESELPWNLRKFIHRQQGQHPMAAKTKMTLADGRTIAQGCMHPDPDNPQKQFWGHECSINNHEGDLYYVNMLADPPQYDHAKKGDIIALACDNVYCPAAQVTDCYYTPGICKDDEWCWHFEHERWGPWGVTSYKGYGQGVNQQGPENTIGWTKVDYCGGANHSMERVENAGNTNGITSKQVLDSTKQLCPEAANIRGINWRPIQAQCVKYRKEWESCLDERLTFTNRKLDPDFSVAETDGMPFERPLRCAKDHICTGSKYYVLPNTCVKARPKDTCFYGSWWDSTDCPRKNAERKLKMPSGLNWNLTYDALVTAILTYPGEVADPGNCMYWNVKNSRAQNAKQTREQLYEIIGILWPKDTLPPPPSLDDIMKKIKSPYECAGVNTQAKCASELSAETATPNCVQGALLAAHGIQFRPCKLWSLVHWFMFNIPNPVPPETADAARALAAFLGEKFVCNDCRAFFQQGVIGHIGLPPATTNADDIAKWFHYGHNIASEHVASTRGTHPWLLQFGDINTIKTPDGKPVSDVQNSWFMPLTTATRQWKAYWKLETLNNLVCHGSPVSFLPQGSVGECFDSCLQDGSCEGFNYCHKWKRCYYFKGLSSTESRETNTCYKIVRNPDYT